MQPPQSTPTEILGLLTVITMLTPQNRTSGLDVQPMWEREHIVRNLLIFISPPPPFLHEMDGLSWKEKDTLLCASRVLAPQIWHISLAACWVP